MVTVIGPEGKHGEDRVVVPLTPVLGLLRETWLAICSMNCPIDCSNARHCCHHTNVQQNLLHSHWIHLPSTVLLMISCTEQHSMRGCSGITDNINWEPYAAWLVCVQSREATSDPRVSKSHWPFQPMLLFPAHLLTVPVRCIVEDLVYSQWPFLHVPP